MGQTNVITLINFVRPTQYTHYVSQHIHFLGRAMMFSAMSNTHSVSVSAGLLSTVLILLIGFHRIKYLIQL